MAIIISNGRARGGCGCLGCAGVLGLGLLLMSLFGMLAGGMGSAPQQAPAPRATASRSAELPTLSPVSPGATTGAAVPSAGATGTSTGTARASTTPAATSSAAPTAAPTPSGAPSSFELFPTEDAAARHDAPAPNGGSWVLSTPSR